MYVNFFEFVERNEMLRPTCSIPIYISLPCPLPPPFNCGQQTDRVETGYLARNGRRILLERAHFLYEICGGGGTVCRAGGIAHGQRVSDILDETTIIITSPTSSSLSPFSVSG